MTADPTVLDRIFQRLVRTLSAGSPDQLSAPFTVSEIVHALVPYRTYRTELGVDTLQDYEHAVLELLAGERGLLVVDPDTVAAIRKELASPDPDTGMLHRLQQVEARLGAVRMPISLDDMPASFSDDTRRDSGSQRAVKLPDAIAIGAAMELEDAAIARAETEALEAEPEADAASEIDEAAPTASAPEPASPSAQSEAVIQRTPTPTAILPSVADLATLMPPEFPPQPLASMQGVTLANPATLSRITPLSVPSVYGDPIDFRGVRHAPVDIGGVIFLFGMIARELGFRVESLSSGSPRCEAKRQMSPGKWARVRIDFELESRHFRDAGRNPSTVDLIVCWRDTWPDRPSSVTCSRWTDSSRPSPAIKAPMPNTAAIDRGGPCPFCTNALPKGRAVTFCPHCGMNVTVAQCPACSSEVQPGWHYCVTCGRDVSALADRAGDDSARAVALAADRRDAPPRVVSR